MEVAAGRPGSDPVTPGKPGRFLLNAVLYLLAMVVACVCVVGGVMSWQRHQERADERVEHERYGDVLAAARTEAEAFVNIDYKSAEESIDRVADGATGDFAKQYRSESSSVVELVKENESVMTGEILWAGVVDVDQDSATVLVATSGTVANVQTDNRATVRNFRLQLELQHVKGRWLTSDLQFVG